MSDISLQVREILAESIPGCPMPPEQMSSELNLFDDLGADSLDLIEACIALEEMFEIEISDMTTEGLDTVGDVIDFVLDHAPREEEAD